MNMKNILTKQQIIKLGKEIQLYQNCIIKMDDMVECKKYAKAKGFIEFDMNTIYYLTTLVQSEALKFILNEEDNNEIGNFITANKVNPVCNANSIKFPPLKYKPLFPNLLLHYF